MPSSFFQWRSLKTKVSLATLAIFLLSIWSLSLYASRMLREDMERQLGEQQFTTVSMLAAQINSELETRFQALNTAANMAALILRDDPSLLQTFMDQRAALQTLFNGGIVIHDMQGTAIADFPLSAGRLGVNYGDDELVAAALKEGKASISKPVIGRKLKAPIIVMTVPIRNTGGEIVGALSGAINLGLPNFFDQIAGNRYGRNGGYLLVAPQYRLIVTATDKNLIMAPLPAPGANETIDSFNTGNEGTAVFVAPEGVEVLSSFKAIPASGWHAVANLPTDEAFSPIRDMQQRMLVATLLLSLLAGTLTWWILQHQLSPLVDTAATLAEMADDHQNLHPLPIVRKDEIGRLIAGFNRLLTTIEQRETLLKQILDTSSVAIFLVDMQGRITQANQRMAEMFGRPLDSLIGDEYVALVHPSDREPARLRMRALLNGELPSVDLDRLYWRADDTLFWGHLTGRPLLEANGNTLGLVGVIADIDVRKKAEKQLENMAHYDVLTALPNRVLLADRLHQAMPQAQRHRQLLAVAYLDLDGFKAINDNHGHEAGDQLLVALAQRMKGTLREGDTLARLGGDEFVAVLLDLPDSAASIPMITRLLTAAAQPTNVGEHVLQVSASLGVTFYPQAEGVDADQLLRQADQAMYQAKLAGKNRYHIFDTEQDRSVRGHHESLQRIQEALAAREFVLFFQPKVNMRSGKIIGAEALIRWQHPEKGLLPPAVFLPVIENHVTAIDIGEWVIDAALTERERWLSAGLDIPVSVNVGARQLQRPDFVARLRHILDSHPAIGPGDLELEVLETSALEDLPGVSQVMTGCNQLGITFALDDFGTGYSSLTYLKRLPVSVLKIDQSFVRDMLDDPDDLAILEGVVSLAATFRRNVIAEGVETVKHGNMLLQLGCELAQGYGIARPMAADALPSWARSWQPDSGWKHVQTIEREDLPLLFAGVEHRAWVVAMEQYLNAERDNPPPLDVHQCRFGQWLDNEGKARQGRYPAFRIIELLHSQIHRIAGELCEGGAGSAVAGDTARIKDLHALSNDLLERLQTLTNSAA